MKVYRPVLLLLLLTAVMIFCAGCASSPQPVETATPTPTVTETPTPVPTVAACGIENCHGLKITCGPRIATDCTSELNADDHCRQYASCQIVDGTCQLVKKTKYDKCVSCVESCKSSFINNPNQILDCSQSC
ncbi:MAG TPA: hypothetical protein PKM50_06045 [Methanoregula sp.]|nr:hypothetical protein [Methanoregula sp.]